MKKIFLISTFIFIMININFVYASYDYTRNTRNRFEKSLRYNECEFDIKDTNVIFTQDDNFYYFDITQKMSNKTKKTNSSTWEVEAGTCVFMITDINSFKNVRLYERYNDSNNASSVSLRIDEMVKLNRVTNSNGEITSDNCDIKVIFPNHLSNNPNNMINYVNIISSKYSGSVDFENEYIANVKISIEKNVLNMGYRYFNFLFDAVYARYASNSSTQDINCGFANKSIDLMNYINCKHNFILYDKNKNDHTYICEFCKWKKNEKHIFSISYDDIENNRCKCGYNKNVKIIFENNINNKKVSFMATPGEILKKAYEDEKGGYDLLYIENSENTNGKLYQKKENIKNLPLYVPDNSFKFKFIYKAHKYYLKFNKKNNLSLDFDYDMDVQEIIFDKETKINKNIYFKKGYVFLGWAVKPDIKKVIFYDMQLIKNLTFENDKIINLYPVFDYLKYSIKYTSNRENLNIPTQIYTYGEEKPLEKFNISLPTDFSFIGWLYKGEKINGNTTKAVEKYVNDENKNLILVANISQNINRNEKTDTDKDNKNQNAKYNDEGPGTKKEDTNKDMDNIDIKKDNIYKSDMGKDNNTKENKNENETDDDNYYKNIINNLKNIKENSKIKKEITIDIHINDTNKINIFKKIFNFLTNKITKFIDFLYKISISDKYISFFVMIIFQFIKYISIMMLIWILILILIIIIYLLKKLREKKDKI